MNDEILKQKYRNLRTNLYYIKNKINRLTVIHNQTYNMLNESLVINDKIIDEDNFFELKNSGQQIINEINNIVIPNINNKI